MRASAAAEVSGRGQDEQPHQHADDAARHRASQRGDLGAADAVQHLQAAADGEERADAMQRLLAAPNGATSASTPNAATTSGKAEIFSRLVTGWASDSHLRAILWRVIQGRRCQK